MASGPGQRPAGPSRLADSLARHRWVTAAGMTATVAVVAGGGVVLALHDSSSGPPKECGLVPCAAALPASVQTTGEGSASAPATAAPTATQSAAAPRSPVASPTSPAAPAPAPGLTPGTAPGLTPGTAPGLAPGFAPAELPAFADRVSVPESGSSCSAVIAFTARGALSTPVRCTFTVVAGRQQRGRDGSGPPGSPTAGQDSDRAVGQLRLGRGGHDGRLGNWLSGWLSRGWPGGGRPGGGRSGGGWPGGR